MPQRWTFPGEFRDRIQIQQRAATRDAYNAPADAWLLVATVAARIQDMNGREPVAAQQQFAEVDTEVSLLWMAGIVPEMRLVELARDRTRVFDVKSVLNLDSRNRELRLFCKELRIGAETNLTIVEGVPIAAGAPRRYAPVELPDGVRAVFTFAVAPRDVATACIFWNGMLQLGGDAAAIAAVPPLADYTWSAARQVTFVRPPGAGDVIQGLY